MRVLYDYQAFAMQKYGGVSRCFAELVRHLPPEVDHEISIKESDNAYIQDLPDLKPARDKFNHFLVKGNFKGKSHIHRLYDKITKGHYYPNYNKYCTIEKLKKGDFDIFHPTFFDDYFLPYLNNKPFVLTIHDMIPERYQQYYGANDFQIIKKRKLAERANAIVSVSETTKSDIIKYLDIPSEKIHVIYHGCSFKRTNNPRRIIDSPYILYVGARDNYKNFIPFVYHSLPFLNNHPEFKIICTGASFSEEEKKLIASHSMKDRVIQHWIQSDEELFSLYHFAMCFVYPSEYEGFGIPILEAYTAECPVLLNNASCFPEIAGDAAIYFDMSSEHSDLSEKLEYINGLSALAKKALLDLQSKRLKTYSWSKSASQLYSVYQSLI